MRASHARAQETVKARAAKLQLPPGTVTTAARASRTQPVRGIDMSVPARGSSCLARRAVGQASGSGGAGLLQLEVIAGQYFKGFRALFFVSLESTFPAVILRRQRSPFIDFDALSSEKTISSSRGRCGWLSARRRGHDAELIHPLRGSGLRDRSSGLAPRGPVQCSRHLGAYRGHIGASGDLVLARGRRSIVHLVRGFRLLCRRLCACGTRALRRTFRSPWCRRANCASAGRSRR